MTTAQKTHWIEVDQFRNKFWAKAKNELGLDPDGVHTILGVKSVKDYPGTYAEAVALLEAAVQPEPPDEAPAPEPVAALADKRDSRVLFEHCAQLPEAPASATTKVRTPNGAVWLCTLRAGLPKDEMIEAMSALVGTIEQFEKAVFSQTRKWQPIIDGRDMLNGNGGPSLPPGPAPARQPSAPAPQAGNAPPVPSGQPPAPNGGEIQRGTARLSKITVDAEGKVQFYCDGFRWPFKDARGAETVAGLFDASAGGWTPAHFVPGSRYDSVGHLVVDWVKPDKYYDVVKVRAA